MSAAPGTIFEVAEQSGDWVRVLMGTEASAWMSASAQGMPLLKPARKDIFVMDPAVRFFSCSERFFGRGLGGGSCESDS